jgi:flavin reductase (DIM6/NTAB) family NADH-FMN oxidoreductase RutF
VQPNQELFRKAMGRFATGVAVLTVRWDDTVKGMTVNAVASASLEPLLLAVCINHRASTHLWVTRAGRFGINILGEDQVAVSRLFAKDKGPFSLPKTVDFTFSSHGSPILDGCIAFLDCGVEQSYKTGDHTLFIGRVDDIQLLRDARPLLFYASQYYHLGTGSSQQDH